MKNQYSQWNQYPNAYSKDNSNYTYLMDDGSKVTLTAGKDGVTEDWIARLKADHIDEMNMLRRGRSKGEGKNKLLSLSQLVLSVVVVWEAERVKENPAERVVL